MKKKSLKYIFQKRKVLVFKIMYVLFKRKGNNVKIRREMRNMIRIKLMELI
jgi:hypothetical protein